MNDQELRRLLASLDEDRPLPTGDAANARAAMLAELDRQLGQDVVAADPDGPGASRLRWWGLAAAAVLIVVVGAFLVMDGRGSEPTVPADSVETVPPATTASFLRACVDFRAATTLGGEPWKAVLDRFVADGVSDQTYLNTLATQLEILATAPRAASFAAELRSAASAARAGADPAVLAIELREIEQLSVRASTIDCLS